MIALAWKYKNVYVVQRDNQTVCQGVDNHACSQKGHVCACIVRVVGGYGRRYIDTSAYLPAYYPPQLQHFMNSYGRKKVLFGSNYPTLRPEMCSAGVADMELAPKTAAAFLRDNAIRVFKLPLKPAAASANKSKL